MAVLDDPDTILRKFKRAVTDSDACVRFDPENKPGVSNLMAIYSTITGQTMEEIEQEFEGKGYGDFKPARGRGRHRGAAPHPGALPAVHRRQGVPGAVLQGQCPQGPAHRPQDLAEGDEKGGYLPL